MKNFVVAFPFTSCAEQTQMHLENALKIKFSEDSKKTLIIPGCPVFFTVALQGAFPGIETLFNEHSLLDPEESLALSKHSSIFFLQFSLKSKEEFDAFLSVAKTLVNAGALGIYVESSGCAWSSKTFSELVSSDVPMEAFLNFVETKDSLFTLGLESFQLPDFCVSLSLTNDTDPLRELLAAVADSAYQEKIDISSGAKWTSDDEKKFEFCKESKPPFAKGTSEHNSLGYVRLLARS